MVKVKGKNECYYVKVDKLESGVTITCGDVTGTRTSIVISQKNWNKIKKEI